MIYIFFDIRFQMIVIFSIYLEQIWFDAPPLLQMFVHSLANAHFKPFSSKKIHFDYKLTKLLQISFDEKFLEAAFWLTIFIRQH